MYDITSEKSFTDVRYWLSCIQVRTKDSGLNALVMEKDFTMSHFSPLKFYSCCQGTLYKSKHVMSKNICRTDLELDLTFPTPG